jgi:hypothetical protein
MPLCFFRKIIKSTVRRSMAAKEAPIPMPACAPVDNEAGLLEGEELDENVVAERTFGPAGWLLLGMVCTPKGDVEEEVRERLARVDDEAIGVKGVRLRGITFIVIEVVPQPYAVRLVP